MRTFSQKPKATQQITSAKTTIPARARFWQSREMDSILHLKRTIGNQAVQQLLQAKQKNRDANSTDNVVLTGFNYDFSRIPVHTNVYSKLQAKQTFNVPGDKCEQHADAVAARVVKDRPVEDLLEPYAGEQSATQAVQMAPPKMCMQQPVKLDRNFRNYFKLYFKEFLATFPEYGDESKLLLEKKPSGA